MDKGDLRPHFWLNLTEMLCFGMSYLKFFLLIVGSTYLHLFELQLTQLIQLNTLEGEH